MARKVFFSFKYEDVFRAMIVRNSWVVLRWKFSDSFSMKPQHFMRLFCPVSVG
jgi:hypothetical protein